MAFAITSYFIFKRKQGKPFLEGFSASLEDLNLKQQQIVCHGTPHPCKCLPFLLLTSIIIFPMLLAFHFNASFTNLTLNEPLNQTERLNRKISIPTNPINTPTSFTQNLSSHLQIADTDGIVLENLNPQSITKNPPRPDIDHPPIQILSDVDFVTQGWPGSGTIDDPYRIANLFISALGTLSDCIEICNTQTHFIIANCTLLDAPQHAAINILNTLNGTLTNNTCLHVHTGIQLTGCSSITIQKNSFFNTVFGIQLTDGSHNNTLRLNTFYGSEDPYSSEHGIASISLVLSSHNYLADNICHITELPFNLTFSHHNTLSNNTSDEASRKGYEAINLWHSHNNTIINNNLLRTIRIDNSQSNIIQGNQLSNIGNLYARLRCIILDGASSDTRIANNTGYSRVSFIHIPLEDILFENNSLWFCGIEFSPSIKYINDSNFQGNTINEQPIIFLTNQTGGSIPTNAAQILLFNCKDIVLELRSMYVYTTGILICHSTNVTVRHHTFTMQSLLWRQTRGIMLALSNSCSIVDNGFSPSYGSSDLIGVELLNCNLCNIDRNHFDDCEYGILSTSSTGLVISENDFSDNYIGINSWNSNSIIITNNLCEENRVGIASHYGEENLISKNTCDDNEIGISLESEYRCIVIENTCDHNSQYGIWGMNLQLVNVTRNICSHNTIGIAFHDIEDASECAISYNRLANNEHGISLEHAHTVIITNNNCTLNLRTGIQLLEGGSNYIADNFCSYNYGQGILLQKENLTAIIWNTFHTNGYGLHLTDGSSYNQILSNDFLWNRVINALNDGINNIFDGNFWSDYQGWDLNFDEYGDIPYQIPGLVKTADYHPRGFTFEKSLQIWLMIFLVCAFLVTTIILGRHLSILAKEE